jgi:hypothetical protein
MVVGLVTENRNHIKSGRRIEEIMFGQITLCGSTYLFLFSCINGCGGRTVIKPGPGFDLDKNKDRTISGDNINFSEFAAIVLGEYFVALFFEVFGD